MTGAWKSRAERSALFAYWIREREAIRLRKIGGARPPWSEDLILQRFRFCCVRREDDRVTRWLRQNWREPFAQHVNLALAITLARFLNWPPTLKAIGFPEVWEPDAMLRRLKERRANGERIWNSAYMITTCGARIDKLEHLFRIASEVARLPQEALHRNSLKEALAVLTAIEGIGDFLGAQIIADLKYVPLHPLAHASDWWTWAVAGPGSERGLRWWHGSRIPRARFLETLHAMREEVEPQIVGIGPLHAQDWQNIACEVEKYVRAASGFGRPKQMFRSTEEDYGI